MLTLEEKKDIGDTFRQRYSLKRYLFFRDVSSNNKREAKKEIINNYFSRTRGKYKTTFFLVTGQEGIFWKGMIEVASAFIKVVKPNDVAT
ncbi:22356_t:CDS:2 [Entrophospora sp. SA101]|nr:6494_t:CDS:2 [Entrophospora sp. SA101]CAJ0749872.1 22356_t:CDS:2 [Entrophospora sp. SA101]CAJ0833658.1 7763_t:CDS:2 [Entrophospora sp. SA101]CAJ0890273.1 10211_t:CDS:2 [Entrophospora sp. SA101]CAJ0924531.1 16484_t:CDS:2 [Entrophospora sp. SA101]